MDTFVSFIIDIRISAMLWGVERSEISASAVVLCNIASGLNRYIPESLKPLKILDGVHVKYKDILNTSVTNRRPGCSKIKYCRAE